jgi:tetratricopeptide (TPR) repeat protein
LFREQKFHSALQRYKSAAEAAPDVAESYFRQGHALVTTNRFELAAKAFKVGIALSDDVTRDGFHVDELYADNHMAKRAHLEALAQSSLIDRANTDLLFLVGLFLRYDGQADRATKFFLKAAEIAGTESLHLRPFLPVEKRDPVLFAATKYET